MEGIEEQVGRVGVERRTRVASGTDGNGVGSGRAGTVNVVLGVANHNGVLGSERPVQVRGGAAHREGREFVAVCVVAPKRPEGKMGREAGTVKFVFGHGFDVPRHQPEADILPLAQHGEEVPNAREAFHVVGANGVLGALYVGMNDVVEDGLRVRKATCPQYILEDGGVGSSRKRHAVGGYGVSGDR